MNVNGDLIRHKRILNGFSVRQFAKHTDLSIGVISNVERGLTKRPHPSTLKKIATGLGCTIADLLNTTE